MKMTLGKKVVFFIVVMAAVLSATALIANNRIINQMVEQHYKDYAWEIAETASIGVDGAAARDLRDEVLAIYLEADPKVGSEDWGSPEFNDYVARFSHIEDTGAFQNARAHLRQIQDLNGLKSIYLIYPYADDMIALYMVDAAYEDACMPGVFDPVYDFNAESARNLSRGFSPYITDTEEYGWLVTAAVPVYDNGEPVALCAVDISMEEVRANQLYYTIITGLVLLVITIAIATLGIVFVDRSVIRPIKKLSGTAKRYSESEAAAQMSEFSALDIHTGDEIQELADSMKRMEKDIHDYYETLLKAKQELVSTKEEADSMNRLANLDALTGVRNKRAYNTEAERLEKSILEGTAQFGLAMVDMNYLKQTNDLYGHEKGDIAIKELCNIICGVFVHSPVFRVGGDEFVVVLEKREYQRRDALAKEFESIIARMATDESLEPWEKLSAAIGYAVYDPDKDKCVEDVLNRADEHMYEQKKKMKVERE